MNTTKKIKGWCAILDANTQSFLDAFGELSFKQLNWKPNGQTWSIAQNIDHIIVINKTYFPIIESIKNGTYKKPFHARFGFMTSFFGKVVLKAVDPVRKKKIKTFTIWEPAQSEIPIEIIERFKEHQNKLKQAIREAEDMLDQGVVISSPANKNIVYKLETAFDIIVTHEQRHFEQAKEVLQAFNKELI